MGRYSNLAAAGGGLTKVRAVAEAGRRAEPWKSPIVTGTTRVRLLLEPVTHEIRAAYEAGDTCLGLARAYGVPETIMREFFRRVGIAMRPQGKVSSNEVVEMLRMREAGWTYRDIGERFGVTRSAVSLRLNRSQGE